MNILVIGAFGYLNNKMDGQTIKTREIYKMLCEHYLGKVYQFDTLKVKQSKNFFLLFDLFWKLLHSDTIIIAPASHSMSTLYPWLYYLSFILRFKIILICVGGWQVEFFLGGHGYTPHPKELKISRKIKAFLPEMKNVNDYLINKLNFNNTEVFPNFRYVADFKPSIQESYPFKVVFMARVHIMKGYDTIFAFSEYVKKHHLDIIIDFYGQIEPVNKKDFLDKLNNHSDIVKYHGALKPENIHTTLSSYDVLVLPTKYYTEGFPGSILDAYISGIPVIATEWKHSHEFIEHGKTGFIVPFGDCQKQFNQRIIELYEDPDLLRMMKNFAKEKSKEYSSDTAWKIISKYL